MSNGEPKPITPMEEQATEIKVMPEQFYFRKMKVPAAGGENKNRKKLILIIVVLVVVLGLMAGAAYLFTESLKREATTSKATPAVTPTPSANVPVANVNVPPVNVPPVNVPPTPVCGNGTCETGESSATCPVDCPLPPPPPQTQPVVLPMAADADADGLTDFEEGLYGTDYLKSDTDSDSYIDGLELLNLYNPAGIAPQKIEETELVKIYSNPTYNYTIFYPTSWLARALGETTSEEVMFTSATGELMEVIVEENRSNLPLLDWYLSEAPGTSPAELGDVTTKSGLVGKKSADGLTAYFSSGGKIYVLSYNVGIKTELNYKSTFEMMIKSFKL
jgi:hypothetical protein